MNIEELNRICRETFIDHVGIWFESFDGERMTATLMVTPKHLQPAGVVHGGVYISMAETLAGAGSMLLVMNEGFLAFGVTVNSQHIASVTGGKITADATLIHKGSFKHIWDVKITDENGKLISISRVTNSIKENNLSGNQNSNLK